MSLLVVSASLARAISGRTRPEREPSRCAPKPFRFGRRRTLKEESVLPGPIENRGKRSSSEGNGGKYIRVLLELCALREAGRGCKSSPE